MANKKVNIIVKAESESKRFKPHMNYAIGKYIHTKADYLKELKQNDLIPYDEGKKIADAKRREMEKPRKTSKWGHDMVEEIRRSKGKPGGAYYAELEKRGYGPEKIRQMKRAADKASSIKNKKIGGME